MTHSLYHRNQQIIHLSTSNMGFSLFKRRQGKDQGKLIIQIL
jgi:hypothetical protein